MPAQALGNKTSGRTDGKAANKNKAHKPIRARAFAAPAMRFDRRPGNPRKLGDARRRRCGAGVQAPALRNQQGKCLGSGDAQVPLHTGKTTARQDRLGKQAMAAVRLDRDRNILIGAIREHGRQILANVPAPIKQLDDQRAPIDAARTENAPALLKTIERTRARNAIDPSSAINFPRSIAPLPRSSNNRTSASIAGMPAPRAARSSAHSDFQTGKAILPASSPQSRRQITTTLSPSRGKTRTPPNGRYDTV